MSTRSYWLDLFTGTTWRELLESGGTVSGFRERRWNSVQRIKPGDYLLCYLTGISRFVGILEVTSKPYKSLEPRIWKDHDFPCRVGVKMVVALTPETAVPVFELREKLTIFQNLKNRQAWTGYFRGSPYKWKAADGETVREALIEAQRNPISREVDQAKLARRPKALQSKIGPVTVPESETVAEEPGPPREPTAHDEIQHLLLKLGSDMGLDVWVARNDRGKEVHGQRFASVRGLRTELPLKFDDVTNKIVELIDVLWLDGSAIVAAFEIESTTSIYSGLLRMSDLLAMQPNISIPLYIVAPDERRDKVIAEVNRPTFLRLKPPLSQVCRYISFPSLRKRLGELGATAKYLRPDFLEELSESCEAEEV